MPEWRENDVLRCAQGQKELASRSVLEGERREWQQEMIKSRQRSPGLSASHLSDLEMKLCMGEKGMGGEA